MSRENRAPSVSDVHRGLPRPVDGRTPTKGEHPCRVCGEPVHRVGRRVSSDGVKGEWRHKR